MSISESRFNMWRAVIAMIHADHVIRPHEINFIRENTQNLPLDETQKALLAEDMTFPEDIQRQFKGITHPRDKEDFFHFAKAIAWSDGDFDTRERAFLERIQTLPGIHKDKDILESAMRNFQEVYIEGNPGDMDKDFFRMVKGLLGLKAA